MFKQQVKEQKSKVTNLINNNKPEDKMSMLLEKITLLEHRLDSMSSIVNKLRNRAGI
jgi:ppGpp synthetase/RelA/SpoT-type nucleotidyltranferase